MTDSILSIIIIVGGRYLFRALLSDSPQGVPIIIAILVYIMIVVQQIKAKVSCTCAHPSP